MCSLHSTESVCDSKGAFALECLLHNVLTNLCWLAASIHQFIHVKAILYSNRDELLASLPSSHLSKPKTSSL